MPWNGSGVFSLNQNFPADRDAGAPAHFIDADKVDDEFENVKTGLEACLTRNGETKPSANVSWNGFRITNLADATSATDAVNRQFGDARYLEIASALADLTDTPAARTALGVAIGVNVQAFSAKLTAIAALSVADGNFIVADGTTFVAESGATARTSIGLGTADNPQFNTINLGHASDTTLARSSAGNVTIEGNLVYRAGGTNVPLADGGTGASDAPTARANLGIGTMATRAVTISTSAPSGGSDGDIWLRYV